MIELYAHPSQNVLKVQIFLEETGLEHRLINDRQLVDGSAEQHRFQAASSTGQVPAIFDPDSGAALFESSAILVYLAEKTGRFLPSANQPAARAEVFKWLMFEAASLTPAMLDIYHYALQADQAVPYAEDRARARAHRALAALEGALAQGRDYLAGDYSIADMILYPWLPILEDFADIPPSDYPHLEAWAARMGARPAVKKAEGA